MNHPLVPACSTELGRCLPSLFHTLGNEAQENDQLSLEVPTKGAPVHKHVRVFSLCAEVPYLQEWGL